METSKSNFARLYMSMYKGLVKLYPHSFRARFEQELLDTFQDLFNQEYQHLPWLNRLVFVFNTSIDLLPSIILEHFQQRRDAMKIVNVIQAIAIAVMAVWATVWVWVIGKWVLLLPLVDPTKWLLGEDFQSVFNSIFGGFMFLAPFLALFAFVAPKIKFDMHQATGDAFVIRLQKMGKAQALAAWICFGITALWWGLVITSRFGLW